MLAPLVRSAALAAAFRRERGTREALLAWRDARLRRVVAEAYARVPFYRALWDRHGVRPEHVAGAADLERLPIVTKADLLAADPDTLVARGLDRARLPFLQTSGSSGEPFTVWRTANEVVRLHALRQRAYLRLGMRPGSTVVRIGVTDRGGPGDKSAAGRLLRRLGLYRRLTLDTFAEPAQLAAWVAEIGPEVLGGYPGVLARIAEAWREAGHPAARAPRTVVTGAEVLTPAMRRTIADAFGARVYDTYGSSEFNLLAWECPASRTGRLHTCDDGMVLEVRRDGRAALPGESGEVVGTSLHSSAMPFIRYRLGDIVTAGGPCDCGAPFGTLHMLQGRMIDYFRLPGGRLLHPYRITDRVVWDTVQWARRYQAVQEREDRIVVRVVPSTTPTEAQLAEIRAAVRDAAGDGVEVALEIVPELPLEPSGKFRTSRSLVESRYDRLEWHAIERAIERAEAGSGA